MFKMDISWY